jgi:hypothetical protein
MTKRESAKIFTPFFTRRCNCGPTTMICSREKTNLRSHSPGSGFVRRLPKNHFKKLPGDELFKPTPIVFVGELPVVGLFSTNLNASRSRPETFRTHASTYILYSENAASKKCKYYNIMKFQSSEICVNRIGIIKKRKNCVTCVCTVWYRPAFHSYLACWEKDEQRHISL